MIRVGTQTTAPTHKYLWPVLSWTCFDGTGLECWWFVELLHPKFNFGTLTAPLVPALCGKFCRPSCALLCVPQRSSPVCFLELVTPLSPRFCKSPFTGQNTMFSLSWSRGLNCLMFGSDRLQSLCRLKARDVMATSVFDKIFQNPQQRHFFFARKLNNWSRTRATGGLVSNLPHPRVNKRKQNTRRHSPSKSEDRSHGN